MVDKGSRVFAYIIATVAKGYRLNGCVPWAVNGHVFFGPCKKNMRPEVEAGDYIVGISRAGVGKHRRVLLCMRVAETMTFAEAYKRGRRNRYLRAARGHVIHVRPKLGTRFEPGNPACYEHIAGAPHASKWRSDLKGERDVFLLSSAGSWVAEAHGPVVSEEMVRLLRTGIHWRGQPTVRNPLTRNARGRHAIVVGHAATKLLRLVRRPRQIVQHSGRAGKIACFSKCVCD